MVIITGLCDRCLRFDKQEDSFTRYSCAKSLNNTFSNVMINHRYRLRTNLTWPGLFNSSIEKTEIATIETFECTECRQFKNKEE